MKTGQILVFCAALLIGSGVHAHDSRLGEQLSTLEYLSSSIARDARRSGLYGNLYYEAERLARDARRLSLMLRQSGHQANIRIRYRELDRQFQRFERKYRSINSRHRRGHIHQDYLSIVGLFGDIRVLYRRGEPNDYRYSRNFLDHRYYEDRQYRSRDRDGGEYRRQMQGKVFSRKHQREFSGGKRFDREDKRRNHYRQ
ncbi:MAG: hypothetical protein R3332_09490 [Pseudohongiellaceae bacterium]|nr:hypothetical protein [Pseudohongiellaceae bacterium]